MSRRSAAQSARLFALTRAAYEASDGVAPWDEEPVASGQGASSVRHAARVRRLTPRTMLCLAAAVAVVVAFVVVRAVVAAGATEPLPESASGAGAAEPSELALDPISFPSPTPSGMDVVVHVAGNVANPGVVTLPAGSRIQDAVQAAGGATEGADLDAINLARPLTDGEQIYLPAPGEVAPQAVAGGGEAPTPGLVNLNTADSSTLQTLPGIGPSLAQRILDWRTEHQGFQAIEELEEVAGIGPAIMERLSELVTV